MWLLRCSLRLHFNSSDILIVFKLEQMKTAQRNDLRFYGAKIDADSRFI